MSVKTKTSFANKHKILFLFLCVITLSLFVIIPLLISLKLTNSNQEHSTKLSTSRIVPNEGEVSPWPENPTEEMDFKSLMEYGLPDPSNLQDLFTWSTSFGVDPYASLTSDAFVEGSKSNPNFEWTNVGYATTTQFKQFLTFYGRDNGLVNFTSISFENVDIDFGLPEFWVSLKYYMPNLNKISIKSSISTHRSMRSLPKEIGMNSFEEISIDGENIGDNYENFLYSDSPLSSKIKFLNITNSNISDHTVLSSDEDHEYYFTDTIFADYASLKNLIQLNLNNNKLTHVGTKLVSLPSIIELRLANNKISTWHNINSNYEETNSGVGQICFPNPTKISYVNISGNCLSEIIHLTPSEWNPTTLNEYKSFQSALYKKQPFVDISQQYVEKTVFIFGHNVSLYGQTGLSDMNVDLSNIYTFEEGLSENDKYLYLMDCIEDRVTNRGPDSASRWSNLKLTKNVMPSIIDLFGDYSNYYNYDQTTGVPVEPDYTIEGSEDPVTTGLNKDNEITPVNYYKRMGSMTKDQYPSNYCFFSSDTSSVIGKYDSSTGAKALKQCMGDEYIEEPTQEDWGFPQGIASTYDSNQYKITITPNYDITVGDVKQKAQSTYIYNVQIFNSEDYIFYLKSIRSNKESELTDYIKSISDKDITVDDVYAHFNELFTYVGSKNKYDDFMYHFDDHIDDPEQGIVPFWKVNYVVNNKETRIMSISITYYVSEFIGEQTDTPVQLTIISYIYMNEAPNDFLVKLLAIILAIEIGLFVILLIPLTYFFIRTRIKSNQIKAEKSTKILEKQKEKEPKINIKENLYKDKKVSFKERVIAKVNTGETLKTKKVKVDPKASKTAQTVVDVDDVLKEIE